MYLFTGLLINLPKSHRIREIKAYLRNVLIIMYVLTRIYKRFQFYSGILTVKANLKF